MRRGPKGGNGHGNGGEDRAADLESSGRVVDFLPAEAADAFCLHGGPAEIVEQLVGVLAAAPAFDYVVLHFAAPYEDMRLKKP